MITLSKYIKKLEEILEERGDLWVVVATVTKGVEEDDWFYNTNPIPTVYCDKTRDFVVLGTIDA